MLAGFKRLADVPTKANHLMITCACPMCQRETQIEVPKEEFKAYCDGAALNDAFPSLSLREREQLQVGYCDCCWDALAFFRWDLPMEDRYVH